MKRTPEASPSVRCSSPLPNINYISDQLPSISYILNIGTLKLEMFCFWFISIYNECPHHFNAKMSALINHAIMLDILVLPTCTRKMEWNNQWFILFLFQIYKSGCKWGSFGYNCNETCRIICANNGTCSATTGTCELVNHLSSTHLYKYNNTSSPFISSIMFHNW